MKKVPRVSLYNNYNSYICYKCYFYILLIVISMVKILLFIWQLPQNLLGLALRPFYKKTLLKVIDYKGKKVFIYDKFPGGISLGRYIHIDYYRESYINPTARMRLKESIQHEYGHCRQSIILGPIFYLLVIGLPSIIWAMCHTQDSKRSYYWFYTEKWADKLGGVKR